MSRSQQAQTFNTATNQNATQFGNSQTSYNQAQQGVTNYQDALAKFSAANPYAQGGQFQTAQTQQAADTANAGAQRTAQAVQSAAVRTGANPAGAIAASEEVARQSQRDQAGQEAGATQQRIAADAGYNQTALNASAVPEQMEAALSQQQGNLAEGNLGVAQKAGEQPSFMDMLGQGLIQAGTQWAAGLPKPCWIAAELWDGWLDPRTILLREWLTVEIGRHWWGAVILRAYSKWGIAVANRMRKDRALRWAMSALFEWALKRAKRWDGSGFGVRGSGLSEVAEVDNGR